MRSRSKPVSQRQLRVGEQIRRLIAEAFQKGDLPEELYGFPLLSVMEAKASSDFSYCKVYVTPLTPVEDVKAFLKQLNDSRSWFRTLLAKNLRLRLAPEVRFYTDEAQERANQIDALLHSPEVMRDLQSAPDDDADGE